MDQGYNTASEIVSARRDVRFIPKIFKQNEKIKPNFHLKIKINNR